MRSDSGTIFRGLYGVRKVSCFLRASEASSSEVQCSSSRESFSHGVVT